jgi:hypothetical protein
MYSIFCRIIASDSNIYRMKRWGSNERWYRLRSRGRNRENIYIEFSVTTQVLLIYGIIRDKIPTAGVVYLKQSFKTIPFPDRVWKRAGGRTSRDAVSSLFTNHVLSLPKHLFGNTSVYETLFRVELLASSF